MEKILFVDACMRGSEISRTHRLCREYLKNYASVQPIFKLDAVDLTKKIPSCYNSGALKNRENLLAEGKTDSATFLQARQFAQADRIIVGAPYWDLSFPAALKAYVENIAVRNITFKQTVAGMEGICRAKKLVYITTAGGYIAKKADFGTEYFRGLCEFFGIPQFESFRAEGLDIETNDPEIIMHNTFREIAKKAL
ncbi:MAG: NAD(P)H-dependent oxidoreductase [Defluviitaleaceae bacterium]|nr:NAD(P)H-dependent oxidoreductase [Defluviitaleaceae bacterium]